MTWGSAPAIRESSPIVCLALALRWHTHAEAHGGLQTQTQILLAVGGAKGQVCATGQRDRPSSTAKCR